LRQEIPRRIETAAKVAWWAFLARFAQMFLEQHLVGVGHAGHGDSPDCSDCAPALGNGLDGGMTGSVDNA
jgi:hypothetical protein